MLRGLYTVRAGILCVQHLRYKIFDDILVNLDFICAFNVFG